jgi:hypothetical protein
MTRRHTPGDWKWFDYSDGRKLLCAPSRAVIHCPDAPMTVTAEDQRLIASAPDLLEALLRAREALKANEEITGTWKLYQHSPEMQCINAAITKATGEPPK